MTTPTPRSLAPPKMHSGRFARPKTGFPDKQEPPSKPHFATHSFFAGLLHLSTFSIWVAAAWSFYRFGHFLIGVGLLLVSLLQLACQTFYRQHATRHAGQACAMPWHELGVALTENGFNERVSVPVSPILHVSRHRGKVENTEKARKRRTPST